MIETTIIWRDAETSPPTEYGEYMVCIGERNRPNGYVYEIAMFIPYDDREPWDTSDANEVPMWVYESHCDGYTYPLDDVIYWAEMPKITTG